QRLRTYIGPEASKVRIATFHSFGLEIIEKYFGVLGLARAPGLMDDAATIALTDAILEGEDWQYLRPRGDAARYFRDLKELISLLKRERIAPEDFEKMLKAEIKSVESDPENLSSRGARKGELKKDAERRIEGLGRTLEAMRFYEMYEDAKREKNLLDYDDVLKYLVNIVEDSEEALNYMREQYLYVLVDEHQDSSGVQNEFLRAVWQGTEQPNIFVVGDDRQLIYGFSGASLEFFDNFKTMFGKAKLVTLVENYRSTKAILDAAHALLESSLTPEKLESRSKENHPLCLVEAEYPRDEIIAAGLEIKKKIKEGLAPEDIAVLVPKNRQARSAMAVLADMGIPVAAADKTNLFDSAAAQALLAVLSVLAKPADRPALAKSFFNPYSGVPPLAAHRFLFANNMREFSLLSAPEGDATLFGRDDPAMAWLSRLRGWLEAGAGESVYSVIQKVGSELLLAESKNHKELVENVEAIRTLLNLALFEIERRRGLTLEDFVIFLERLESYGEDIPIAVFGADRGVRVLTLHGSKGLEFDFVWIAHLDEKSLYGARQGGFTLPEELEARTEQADREVKKRELYVAITRAKRFCTLSYSKQSLTGAELHLADIVADIEEHFEKISAADTEENILKKDPRDYVAKQEPEMKNTDLEDLKKIVARDYEDRKVSVSLLNNFFECPWKWYFRNLLQLPEPQAESLEFGNIVHGSIDEILKLAAAPKAEEIKKIIEVRTKKTGFGGEKKQKDLARQAFAVVEKWVKNRLPEISKNRENEQSISVADERFPNLTIYGKVDLIEMLGKSEVRVTDFKTGGARKKSEIEKIDEEGRMSDYLRQLAMYSYLLKENKKWGKEVAESRLEFVEAKTAGEAFYSTFIDAERIDLLVRDIADYDKLVKSGQWTARPCHFKSYGKSGAVCEYCELSKIYKS
ncbi:MAG TPA: ATP-dependent DNA helicase, partial [Candidatus Paceibacterota bacterium]|nr:ATP-dependent DNA helicase [Candidatus Paceibacterota bacterium]